MAETQTIKERIVERYGRLSEDSRKFSDIINEPLKQSFRINTIKGEKEDIISQMMAYDSSIKKVAWCDNAFESDLTNLGSSIQHFAGQIYIQELTSMIPPLIVSDLIKKKQDYRLLRCTRF